MKRLLNGIDNPIANVIVNLLLGILAISAGATILFLFLYMFEVIVWILFGIMSLVAIVLIGIIIYGVGECVRDFLGF